MVGRRQPSSCRAQGPHRALREALTPRGLSDSKGASKTSWPSAPAGLWAAADLAAGVQEEQGWRGARCLAQPPPPPARSRPGGKLPTCSTPRGQPSGVCGMSRPHRGSEQGGQPLVMSCRPWEPGETEPTPQARMTACSKRTQSFLRPCRSGAGPEGMNRAEGDTEQGGGGPEGAWILTGGRGHS